MKIGSRQNEFHTFYPPRTWWSIHVMSGMSDRCYLAMALPLAIWHFSFPLLVPLTGGEHTPYSCSSHEDTSSQWYVPRFLISSDSSGSHPFLDSVGLKWSNQFRNLSTCGCNAWGWSTCWIFSISFQYVIVFPTDRFTRSGSDFIPLASLIRGIVSAYDQSISCHAMLLQVGRDNLCKNVLLLAYQSFGIIFADLCISPLYVYRVTFSGKLRHHQGEEVIFGAFSLIFWTLTLLSLLKYAVFMLSTDDNGEGMMDIIPVLIWRT